MENVAFMRKAKEQLRGKWKYAVIGTLIYCLIGVAVSSLQQIFQKPALSMLTLLITGPLALGHILFISCLVDTAQCKYDLLFAGFKRYAQTFIAGVLTTLLILVGWCLLIVPGIIISLGLSMTFFVMADEPEISGVEAMKKSWAMMNGHKWDFFCLNLRFIGWAILAVITLGIGALWLNPYMYASYLNFYRQLRYGTF